VRLYNFHVSFLEALLDCGDFVLFSAIREVILV